jgi:hypothetical protein
MPMFLYESVRKLSKREAEAFLGKARQCVLGCAGTMARIAERSQVAPYPWVPEGYICTKCNSMVMGINT